MNKQKINPAEMSTAAIVSMRERVIQAIARHSVALTVAPEHERESIRSRYRNSRMLVNKLEAELASRSVCVEAARAPGMSAFESFASVARAVLPDELWKRIAGEAVALLGDEVTPDQVSVLFRVRAPQ